MRIGVKGDAVRPEFLDLAEGARKRRLGLARQAVDQVHIDGFKAERARLGDQREHLLRGLDAVHGFLHVGVKVLHAEAQAVKAQGRQRGQALVVHGARVHLDGHFRAGHDVEIAPEHVHEPREFRVGQEGRCAPAQVQLAHGLARAQARRGQGHFALQVAQVGGGAAVLFGDDLVAGAVVAQRLAKRDVHIQRQRRGRGFGPRAPVVQRAAVVAGAKGLDKAVRRGEGGVARPGDVEGSRPDNCGHGVVEPRTAVDASECAQGVPGKARQRCGLLPTRRSNRGMARPARRTRAHSVVIQTDTVNGEEKVHEALARSASGQLRF